jgi:hypothetical protein
MTLYKKKEKKKGLHITRGMKSVYEPHRDKQNKLRNDWVNTTYT